MNHKKALKMFKISKQLKCVVNLSVSSPLQWEMKAIYELHRVNMHT